MKESLHGILLHSIPRSIIGPLDSSARLSYSKRSIFNIAYPNKPLKPLPFKRSVLHESKKKKLKSLEAYNIISDKGILITFYIPLSSLSIPSNISPNTIPQVTGRFGLFPLSIIIRNLESGESHCISFKYIGTTETRPHHTQVYSCFARKKQKPYRLSSVPSLNHPPTTTANHHNPQCTPRTHLPSFNHRLSFPSTTWKGAHSSRYRLDICLIE